MHNLFMHLTKNYKKSKLLIVCSAYELYEESTFELLNYNKNNSREYIKDFVFVESKEGKDPDKRNYIVSNKKILSMGYKFKFDLRKLNTNIKFNKIEIKK